MSIVTHYKSTTRELFGTEGFGIQFIVLDGSEPKTKTSLDRHLSLILNGDTEFSFNETDLSRLSNVCWLSSIKNINDVEIAFSRLKIEQPDPFGLILRLEVDGTEIQELTSRLDFKNVPPYEQKNEDPANLEAYLLRDSNTKLSTWAWPLPVVEKIFVENDIEFWQGSVNSSGVGDVMMLNYKHPLTGQIDLIRVQLGVSGFTPEPTRRSLATVLEVVVDQVQYDRGVFKVKGPHKAYSLVAFSIAPMQRLISLERVSLLKSPMTHDRKCLFPCMFGEDRVAVDMVNSPSVLLAGLAKACYDKVGGTPDVLLSDSHMGFLILKTVMLRQKEAEFRLSELWPEGIAFVRRMKAFHIKKGRTLVEQLKDVYYIAE